MTKGFLEVGTNGKGEVVINHPNLQPDETGVGHIVFSPEEAMSLSDLLAKQASVARREQRLRRRGFAILSGNKHDL